MQIRHQYQLDLISQNFYINLNQAWLGKNFTLTPIKTYQAEFYINAN